jgi:hypothetical protein
MPTTPHLLDELRRYPFAGPAIRNAPVAGGAYVLWEDHELTLVGSTPSIRARLLEYLQGTRHCACSPTHFSWRVSGDPELAERQLLYRYSVEFLCIPRCNCKV